MSRAQKRLAVELTTAHELAEAEAESIIKTIERASGRTVDATRSVDESLVGGIVLQVGAFSAPTPASEDRPRAAPARSLQPRIEHPEPTPKEPRVKLRPKEITAILKDRIREFDVEMDLSEVGTVLQLGDGIAARPWPRDRASPSSGSSSSTA